MNLLELNKPEMQMIEEMGATGFSPAEIAEVLELDKELFIEEFNKKTTLYKTYRKGFLKAQLELRERIMKDAKHGSSPAQTLMKKIFDDADHLLKQL